MTRDGFRERHEAVNVTCHGAPLNVEGEKALVVTLDIMHIRPLPLV